MPPTIILCTYTTRPVPHAAGLVPEFQPNAGTKDPDKQAAQVAEKRERFLRDAAGLVYVSTLDQVRLIAVNPDDPGRPATLRLSGEGRGPGTDKPAVSVKVCHWLTERFPDAWKAGLWTRTAPPDVIFLGFDPKRFLKIVGLESAMPLYGGRALPLMAWAGTDNHRDMTSLLLPEKYSGDLDWPQVIASWKLGREGDSLAGFERITAGWHGPGRDVDADMTLLASFAIRMEILPAKFAVSAAEE